MAHTNKVMRSVNSEDGTHCVDLFMRPDGSFGYEEFRRDIEDNRGWFPIGHFSEKFFVTSEDAWATALATITWLREAAAH